MRLRASVVITPERLEPRLPLSSTDVLTYQDNNARTGEDLHEKLLTPQNVNSATFGLRFNLLVDGKVDAQPLYVSNLKIGAARHNVVFVATEHDSLYAFDADAGTLLWQTSLLGVGEVPSDPRGCTQVTPEIGITSTPIIDRKSQTIYAVAMSKDAAGNYFQRLHAIDITTGAEKFGGAHTISATFPGTGANSSNGTTVFDPAQYKERCALLLSRGIIYTSWASHCDIPEYGSWVMSFDAHTLQPRGVLNLTPNGNEGAFWAAGGGPAADANGNVYLISGNGTFDENLTPAGFPSQGDFGDSFIKLAGRNSLRVADYFTPANQAELAANDLDFGSTAPLLLPPMKDSQGHTRQLAVGAGKDAVIYLVDRQHMGKFSANNSSLYQQVTGGVASGVFASPAYFNGKLYYGSVNDTLKAFTFSNARLSKAPAAQSANVFGYPGASPSISANGKRNGIVWAAENTDPAVLHAYDANDLSHELYNSTQAGPRDQFGAGNKFITPMVANGEVFVGTTNSVGVFGLLGK